MSFGTKIPPILLLICYQLLLADAGATCYYPDHTIAEPLNYVCNTTSGEHSACCGPGDPCTVNGYCFGSAGYMYRGGCTDITWQSPDCCPGCRDSAVDSFSNLYACPLNNGSRSKHWCCGASEEGSNVVEAGCCDTTLFAPDFGVFANAETVVNTTDPNPSTWDTPSSHTTTSPSSVASPMSPSLPEPAVTTTLTSIPTPTPTPVEPSSGPAQPSQKSVAVGTEVGVPVGVLSLFSLVLLFLRERRRRIHAQKMTDDAHATAEERERQSKTIKPYELHDYASPQELENVHHGPQEISSREVYEANGGF